MRYRYVGREHRREVVDILEKGLEHPPDRRRILRFLRRVDERLKKIFTGERSWMEGVLNTTTPFAVSAPRRTVPKESFSAWLKLGKAFSLLSEVDRPLLAHLFERIETEQLDPETARPSSELPTIFDVTFLLSLDPQSCAKLAPICEEIAEEMESLRKHPKDLAAIDIMRVCATAWAWTEMGNMEPSDGSPFSRVVCTLLKAAGHPRDYPQKDLSVIVKNIENEIANLPMPMSSNLDVIYPVFYGEKLPTGFLDSLAPNMSKYL